MAGTIGMEIGRRIVASVRSFVAHSIELSAAALRAQIMHAALEVKEQIGQQIGALAGELGELRTRVAEMPKPRDGEQGPPGPAGKDADPEMVRLVVAEVLPDAIERAQAVLSSRLEAGLAAIPRAKDGQPGKDGKDGESVHPDTVARMVLEQVQTAMVQIRMPKDGEPGRDAAAIEWLPAVDERKSYPRGTFADYRNGMIRAMRNTDPLYPADGGQQKGLEEAGWLVCMNGIANESEESLDEGRTIRRTTTYTNGKQLVRDLTTNAIIYREIWREGQYDRGDVVTWSGSSWFCLRHTINKPGNSPDWRLMVKRGMPGKDAEQPTEMGVPVVRLRG